MDLHVTSIDLYSYGKGLLEISFFFFFWYVSKSKYLSDMFWLSAVNS